MIHYNSQPVFFATRPSANFPLWRFFSLLSTNFEFALKDENPPQLEIIYNHLSSLHEKNEIRRISNRDSKNKLLIDFFPHFYVVCFYLFWFFFCKRRKLLEIKKCIQLSDKTNEKGDLFLSIFSTTFFLLRFALWRAPTPSDKRRCEKES